MPHDDIEEAIRRRPFQPFRLFVTDGKTYDVRHPELVMLGKRSLAVGLAADLGQTSYDRLAQVDLLHVTRLEPLEAATVEGNGAAGG